MILKSIQIKFKTVYNISGQIITLSWKLQCLLYILASLFVCNSPGAKKKKKTIRKLGYVFTGDDIDNKTTKKMYKTTLV